MVSFEEFFIGILTGIVGGMVSGSIIQGAVEPDSSSTIEIVGVQILFLIVVGIGFVGYNYFIGNSMKRDRALFYGSILILFGYAIVLPIVLIFICSP